MLLLSSADFIQKLLFSKYMHTYVHVQTTGRVHLKMVLRHQIEFVKFKQTCKNMAHLSVFFFLFAFFFKMLSLRRRFSRLLSNN